MAVRLVRGVCEHAARGWLASGALAAALLMTAAPHAAAGQSQEPGGTIRGHVRLMSAAPPNPVIRMGADPACSQANAGRRLTQEFVVRSADGGLANVFVHLQGTFPPTPVPTTPVVLQQRACVYQPHVIGIRAGQPLQITNDDPTVHNVHSLSSVGNDINASRPARTPPLTVTFEHEELMLRLTCEIHSWMNIFVGVMSHPYFAVTDPGGAFEIANVPPGHHTVQAWHERYGPLTAIADVQPGATTSVDFTYTGSEKAAPPSARVVVPQPAVTVYGTLASVAAR